MKINYFLVLATLPQLLVDGGVLEHDVEGVIKDPAIKAELSASNLVKGVFDDLSAEWRKVEADEIAIKKSNILTVIPRSIQFLKDAGVLLASAERDGHSLSLRDEVAKLPHLQAALEAMSPHWRAIEEDLGGLL